MANPIHLAKVKQGADQWNHWRGETSDSHQVDLVKADLRAGVLIHANLRNADLRRAVLRVAVLLGADLRYADLSRTDARFAILCRAQLRNAKLFKGTFSEADMRGADLTEVDARFAKLRKAKLRGATILAADLRGADLRSADLTNADLSNTDLQGADLRDAVLTNVDLSLANWRGAKLSHQPDLLQRVDDDTEEVTSRQALARHWSCLTRRQITRTQVQERRKLAGGGEQPSRPFFGRLGLWLARCQYRKPKCTARF
jgi:hypothetical protein